MVNSFEALILSGVENLRGKRTEFTAEQLLGEIRTSRAESSRRRRFPGFFPSARCAGMLLRKHGKRLGLEHVGSSWRFARPEAKE